mmetsp:Transcript_23555/g.50104  ORF Transcript_23555/g.50104 Transcript_23555/m.50104 type:complete len:229 (-) Transcript_23555:39-725(-)
MCIHGILLLNKRGLTSNLCGDFVVGKTGSRENGNLLSASDGVHDINGGNSSLNHSLRVITRRGVDGHTVDIKVGLGENLWCLIDNFSRSIEGSTKHLLGNSHLQNLPSELALGFSVVNLGGSFENLHDGTATRNLKNLSRSLFSISQRQVDNLVIFGKLYIVQNNKGTVHTGDSSVLETRDSGVILDDLKRVKSYSFRGVNNVCHFDEIVTMFFNGGATGFQYYFVLG